MMHFELSEGAWAAIAALAVGLVGYGSLQSDLKHATQLAVEAKTVAAAASIVAQEDARVVTDRLARIEERQQQVYTLSREMRDELREVRKKLESRGELPE